MKIKVFALLLLILFSACKNNPKQEASKTKPNIVFIFTDDQTYSAIHNLENREISTPNIDKLVAQGTTFTNAHNIES